MGAADLPGVLYTVNETAWFEKDFSEGQLALPRHDRNRKVREDGDLLRAGRGHRCPPGGRRGGRLSGSVRGHALPTSSALSTFFRRPRHRRNAAQLRDHLLRPAEEEGVRGAPPHHPGAFVMTGTWVTSGPIIVWLLQTRPWQLLMSSRAIRRQRASAYG